MRPSEHALYQEPRPGSPLCVPGSSTAASRVRAWEMRGRHGALPPRGADSLSVSTHFQTHHVSHFKYKSPISPESCRAQSENWKPRVSTSWVVYLTGSACAAVKCVTGQQAAPFVINTTYRTAS